MSGEGSRGPGIPLRVYAWLLALAGAACAGPAQPGSERPAVLPSILLVTLDTTRADSIGPSAKNVATPAFNDLARRGRLYTQAYATAPETLPSHASMMTGLYPAGHGVHENGRFVGTQHPVLAERLAGAGYRTAAFVSSFVLSRRFGLARGFTEYDDEMPEGAAERGARATTDRALAFLEGRSTAPTFLWVHYFDPHAPYDPPEPYRSQHAADPYRGEIAAMDAELGRLVQAFEQQAAGPSVVIVVADHGEGLGDHGESQHGMLAYQSTMHVPLVVAGRSVDPGVVSSPISTRRIYDLVLGFSGGPQVPLDDPVVLGEAMKPFLNFGWQPQVMGVSGTMKTIVTSGIELYDLASDPGETRELSRERVLPAPVRRVVEDYPVPSPHAARPPDAMSAEDRAKLASLGYVSAGAAPAVRRDAPRPADMTRLFEPIERASALFVAGRFREVLAPLREILRADPGNLDAALRLATAESTLGQVEAADASFRRAAEIAPQSKDVRAYLGLHYARGANWRRAVPLLEEALAAFPERLAVLEALATLRIREGRLDAAADLLERVYALRPSTATEAVAFAELAMRVERTRAAIGAFERARALDASAFRRDLDLGVLYLAERRYTDARDALDRALARDPRGAMALFKRAQVSVLLQEADRSARIARAREHADRVTQPLIAAEKLFK